MKYSALFALFMSIFGVIALSPAQAQNDLVYVAVEPCRIVDTRNAGGDIAANSFRNFQVSGTLGELSVQGGKSDCLDPKAGTGQKPLAIVAYVLAVPPGPGSGSGVLTAYPSNKLPPPAGSGSTVNFAAHQVIGNTTTITICDPAGSCPTDGEFAILARNTNQHVIIDVQGYFYPQVGGAKGYVVVDSGDQVIGGAIGDGDGGADPLIMSSKGYIATISIYNGIVLGGTSIFFTGANCTGDAYVSISDNGEVDIGGGQTVYFSRQMIGEISNLWGYDSPNNQVDYWYVPKTPTLVNDIQMNSLEKYDTWGTGNMECYTVSYVLPTAAEAFPNNPAITGIPNTAFSAPLRYDYR